MAFVLCRSVVGAGRWTGQSNPTRRSHPGPSSALVEPASREGRGRHSGGRSPGLGARVAAALGRAPGGGDGFGETEVCRGLGEVGERERLESGEMLGSPISSWS